jgi:hypothetical protein
MRSRVNDGEQQHRIGELPVHPDVFIKWDESDFGSDEPHNGSADGEQNKHPVHTQNQTGTS